MSQVDFNFQNFRLLAVLVIILSNSLFSKVISYLLMSRQNCKCLMVNCLVFLLKIPSCIPDLLYINAIDLTLNGFCQNRGQGFSMGGKPKPCKLVSSMYLAHIVTQTMCYLLHTVQIKKYILLQNLLKFRFSKKATKILQNLPAV